MTERTIARVVECIAKTTRYPKTLLVETADLENDLGIDSVKRLEIIVAIEQEFDLKLEDEERDPAVRTIGNIADWIGNMVDKRSQPAPTKLREQDRHVGTPPPSERRHDERSHVVHTPSSRLSSPPHFSPTAAPNGTPVATKSLAGRVAFVTGSGRSVGRTIARVLASRGATVIVNSFHSREQGEQTAADIRAQGGSAIHLWGSVANPDHVDQMFSEIEQQYGRLDILVCNASDGRIGPFMEISQDDWDRAFRTNVSGHHRCAVKASELMRHNGGGSIVTMSAIGAKGYVDGLGSQGVVKAAVETLTRYLACELGRFGIRVNCVAGGPIYGELISKFPNAQAMQNHWESMTPDGELCSPLDLANTIAFLVGDEAKGINGSVWMVDHGFSALADGRPMRFASQQNAFSPQ